MLESSSPRDHGSRSSAAAHGGADDRWTRDVIERLAFASLQEQKRARRWSIFFKFVLFAYLIAVLLLTLPIGWFADASQGRHTALVEVSGVIAPDSNASADRIVQGLRSAFENEDSAAVILRINSPGGSPVQAGYVNDEIKRLKAEHPDKTVYAVITDMAASGGYYVAAGADRIYADKASLVGSIGVVMNGFGFVDTMEMFGVERRLIAAGEHKGFLDPFSPADADEVDHVRSMLGEIHRQFIQVVRNGRGDRLKDDPDLFSGLVWTGEKGVELGLVDALGSSSYVAREVVGAKKIVNYTPRRNVAERLAERFGAGMAAALATRLNAGFGEVPR
ncbi:MAG: S49 family peptidase [Gammaproteobacteria bacterium]